MAISGRRPKRREIRIRACGRRRGDEDDHADGDGDDHADDEGIDDDDADIGIKIMMQSPPGIIARLSDVECNQRQQDC